MAFEAAEIIKYLKTFKKAKVIKVDRVTQERTLDLVRGHGRKKQPGKLGINVLPLVYEKKLGAQSCQIDVWQANSPSLKGGRVPKPKIVHQFPKQLSCQPSSGNNAAMSNR